MNELQEEVIISRLIERIESGNTFILTQIGKTIREIGNLTPNQARKLQQMIKYGARYDTILERLARITNTNVDEIDDIFNAYAKKDYQFAEKFYKYRNIDFIPFNQFEALKLQTSALSNITKGTYMNLTNTSAIGFTITDLTGNVRFFNISQAYQYAIDQALLSISQGKDTFDHQMYSLLKSLGESGIKTINYGSGATRRLDSAIRMNLREGIRNLHNETQKIIGQDFGADGVEISVHENPAEDHQDLQGRQFSYEEFDNLQNNLPAKDYKGITYTHEHRPISEYNCYHNVFAIVLGVSEPQYTNEQLEQIKQRNNKGFEFEGKHYTMYQGTQLQRRLETEIRRQKDTQILAKESNNKELIADSQYKITQLTTKYKELCNASGLLPYMERMRVASYKRVNVKKL
jgi:hypothetical protein